MKKLLAILLAAVLLLSLAACGGETAQPDSGKTETKGQTGDNSDPTKAPLGDDPTEAPNEEITPDNWGATEKWTATNGGKTTMFYINFPQFSGARQGTGTLSAHSDGSVVIVSGQHKDDMDVQSFDTFFPDYFEDLKVTLKDYYSLRGNDYVLDVQSSKTVTVGSYEMYKFNGNFSMSFKGDPRAYVYVAYATKLETNDAYVYWFLYGTEDQIDMLEEYAYNMGLTLRLEY